MINKIKAMICKIVPKVNNCGPPIKCITLNNAPRVIKIIPITKSVMMYFNFIII